MVTRLYNIDMKSIQLTTMNKKGNITIPAKMRKKHNFKEGQKFCFLETGDGIVLVPLLTLEEFEKNLIPIKEFRELIEIEEKKELELENNAKSLF